LGVEGVGGSWSGARDDANSIPLHSLNAGLKSALLASELAGDGAMMSSVVDARSNRSDPWSTCRTCRHGLVLVFRSLGTAFASAATQHPQLRGRSDSCLGLVRLVLISTSTILRLPGWWLRKWLLPLRAASANGGAAHAPSATLLPYTAYAVRRHKYVT
jgi:hypothetical protein